MSADAQKSPDGYIVPNISARMAVALAMAVIEEMKTPTDEMMIAGMKKREEADEVPTNDIYLAYINAAKTEEEAPY